MTRLPMASDDPSTDNSYAGQPIVTETYFEQFDELTTQGEGAERIAEGWGFSRAEVDKIPVDSQSWCGEAWEAGKYDDQVVTVETEYDGDSVTVETTLRDKLLEFLRSSS